MRKLESFACPYFTSLEVLVFILLPDGSDLSRRDTESGHNMCDETGKENLQVGNVHLQYGTTRTRQSETRQHNRDHLGCIDVCLLLCWLWYHPQGLTTNAATGTHTKHTHTNTHNIYICIWQEIWLLVHFIEWRFYWGLLWSHRTNLLNCATGLILNNFPSLQNTFCYFSSVTKFVCSVQSVCLTLFSCQSSIIDSKCMVSQWCMLDDRSSYYFIHIHFLSCLLARCCIGLYCCKQGKLTCDQSLSQDKDHYREVHFPQSANP